MHLALGDTTGVLQCALVFAEQGLAHQLDGLLRVVGHVPGVRSVTADLHEEAVGNSHDTELAQRPHRRRRGLEPGLHDHSMRSAAPRSIARIGSMAENGHQRSSQVS